MAWLVPRPDRRQAALYVLCVGMLMIILDQTIVNVALPSIQVALHFSQSRLAWIINAYLIAFGGLLLLAGRLGDLVGRKRVFLGGLGLFTLASLACGLSTSADMLIAARFIQGVGGAASSAVILGMIVTMFPGQREQANAIGVFSFTASAGASVGLLAGGLITQVVSWNWIFFVNLPIGVAAGLLAYRLIEDDRGLGLRHGADVLGAALVTGGLMLAVAAIVGAGGGGVFSYGLGAVAVLLLAGFLARQATARNPLLPLRIFDARNVSGANLVQVLLVAGLLGFFFLCTLYFRQVLGWGPLEIGLAFLPVALTIAAFSLGLAGRLLLRFGARGILLPGLVLTMAGLLLMARAPIHSSYPIDLLPSMLLIGLGAGVCFPAVMSLGMSGATEHDSGLASGVLNTTAQVGGAVGLAVLATVAAAQTGALVTAGDGASAALYGGFHLVFLLSAALIGVAIAVALVVLRAPDAAAEVVPEAAA